MSFYEVAMFYIDHEIAQLLHDYITIFFSWFESGITKLVTSFDSRLNKYFEIDINSITAANNTLPSF